MKTDDKTQRPSYIERVASGHLILWFEPEGEAICLQLDGSRFGMRMQPGELEPDQMGNLNIWISEAFSDINTASVDCEHGLPPHICMKCRGWQAGLWEIPE